MEIGKPTRILTVEPVRDPIPQEQQRTEELEPPRQPPAVTLPPKRDA
jgi:hypothetical protein